jgi:membrane protease YdiL (CAAX protease family)
MFLLSSAEQLTGFQAFLEKVKPILPIPAVFVVIPGLFWFFKDTWRELDEEASKGRAEALAEGKYDKRPIVLYVMVALILALQEYYGNRGYFVREVKPLLVSINAWLGTKGIGTSTPGPSWLGGGGPDGLRLGKYGELWDYGWWAATRIFGYMLPLGIWRFFFRKDSVLDFGLRTKGFFAHIKIYGLFLAVVLPAMFIVAKQPDFGGYYPFYKQSSRSWFDFLLWETMYFAQFFALEVFFRGFWVGALRKSLGSGAIFAMAVPYCMIHFGKPYLEAVGAIIAGIALGSLSMKTKSIYQGFLVHITVAGLMDWLSLLNRGQLPHTFWPAASG